ncbi:MAG: tRNA (adenosine(37)-N6)-dimethylallyltransferase MiaA [Bacteroidetes bacterium MedPE-SWsnd-G1]|nr:MAG: tRNA (adenosine(37)-N6)-dimethylallyltransferase MiaA [Bacteroidetes bacterium MedPE-SWsnd-G1]
MPRKYLISVVGATAIGKTALSISLAKHYNAPIISCDSRQFFKEMNIGTAVPSKEELALAEHHFIQSRSIHDDYSVGQFEKDALAKLKELFKANEIVIMVGGSGLYVDAVLKGLDYFPKVDPSIRQELNTKIETEGIKSLQEQLKILDVDSYNSIEIENPHRLIRALEICIGTDKPYSYYKNKPKTPREFVPIKIGLTADRAIMYDRINQRVDIMINSGLLEEVKPLLSYKHLNALQTVGYRELFEYFEGKFTLDFAIEELKKNTRRFAKRQGTWFRKDKDIRWFDFQSDLKDIITFVDTRKQT